jgi:hypothetical protein
MASDAKKIDSRMMLFGFTKVLRYVRDTYPERKTDT